MASRREREEHAILDRDKVMTIDIIHKKIAWDYQNRKSKTGLFFCFCFVLELEKKKGQRLAFPQTFITAEGPSVKVKGREGRV